MKKKRHILLLEDDPNLGFILKEHLEMQGFAVTLCTNGVEGERASSKGSFVLCLVDVMMPKKDGFTFVRDLRKRDQSTPVIFLTAKALKEDRIEGFKVGGDDYVTKPFSMEELMLRIQAVLKRTGSPADHQDAPEKEFHIGTFLFDVPHSQLRSGKKSTSLTAKEAGILQLLCRRPNTVVEREEILQEVWGENTIYTARSMDVYISKLRKHLAKDASVSIVTVHGKGVKLIVPSA